MDEQSRLDGSGVPPLRAVSDRSDRPVEFAAVKTTIVGGRPPGCGKPVGDIPRGVEVLVKKASVDAAFKAALLARRSAAAGEIGLTLDPAEVAMLDAVPAAQLAAIIARTRVDERIRPAFLGKVAGVMLVALGAATLADDGCERWRSSAGTDPSDPNRQGRAAAPADLVGAVQLVELAAGEQPAAPAGAALPPGQRVAQGGLFGNRPGQTDNSAGSRPDRPETPPGQEDPNKAKAKGKLIDILKMTGDGSTVVDTSTPRPPLVRPPPATQPTTAPASQPAQADRPRLPGDPPAVPQFSEMAVEGQRWAVAPPVAPGGARPDIPPVNRGLSPQVPPITQPAPSPTSQPTSQPAAAEQIDRLIAQLDAKDFPARAAAEQSLVTLGLRVVVPRLKTAIQSKKLSAEAATRAARIVGLGDEIDMLIKRLDVPAVPMAGVPANQLPFADEAEPRLLKIGQPAAPMLKEALDSKKLSPEATIRATRILQKLQSPADQTTRGIRPDRPAFESAGVRPSDPNGQ